MRFLPACNRSPQRGFQVKSPSFTRTSNNYNAKSEALNVFRDVSIGTRLFAPKQLQFCLAKVDRLRCEWKACEISRKIQSIQQMKLTTVQIKMNFSVRNLFQVFYGEFNAFLAFSQTIFSVSQIIHCTCGKSSPEWRWFRRVRMHRCSGVFVFVFKLNNFHKP